MSDTHTHGLDDIACPERLVGECVIEREVAHAVAIEREKVAAWLEGRARDLDVYGIGRLKINDMTGPWAIQRAVALEESAKAIRNGAHDEATR